MLGADLMVHEPIVESLLSCSAELMVSGGQVVDVLGERHRGVGQDAQNRLAAALTPLAVSNKFTGSRAVSRRQRLDR
jgi:hypothetical protein